MIFCLIGSSASGKTTVETLLSEVGIKRIISYTTRPMRKGEKNGVQYHFIDDDTFLKMASEGKFAETAKYREWFYGLSLEGIDYKNDNYVAVVTIHGYKELVKIIGKENVIAINIKVEERERLIRQLERGDDVDEVIRRLHADREDFKDVEKICDYVVENKQIAITTEEVYSIIERHSTAK